MRLPAPVMPVAGAHGPTGAAGALAADAPGWQAADGLGGAVLARRPLLSGPADVPAFERRAPALAAWLAGFDAPWRAVEARRFAPGAHTPACAEARPEAFDRVTLLLPLSPGLVLDSEAGRQALAPGQAVLVDTWRRHRLANLAATPAVLVVATTAGSDAFAARAGLTPPAAVPSAPLRAECGDAGLDPWRLQARLATIVDDVPGGVPAQVGDALARLVRTARAAWAAGRDGDDSVADAAREARARLLAAGAARLRLRNGLGLLPVLDGAVFAPLMVEPCPLRAATSDPHFDRPVFIVSSPRAGSTLLFETLARLPGVVTIGDESHALIEGLPPLSPAAHGWASNRLAAANAAADVAAALRTRFLDTLHDRDGHRVDGLSPVRMVEKTPKNALRVPFLRAVFPEARFLYLHRDPRQVVASMIDAWSSGRFRTYPALPGWSGPPWSLLLVPGWRALAGRPLEAIVGAQWATTVRVLLDDLADVPAERVLGIDYADLLADPRGTVARIADWAGFAVDDGAGAELPLSRYTVSAPDAQKWRRREAEVEAALAEHADLVERAARAYGAGRAALRAR